MEITTSGGVTKVGTGNFTITSGQQFTGSYIQNGGVTTLANTNGPGLFNGQGGDIVIGNSGSGSTYSTLRMGAANQLGTNVNVTFGTNATTSSYGTLDLMGYNLSIGNLNVSGNQALAHVQNSQSLAYSGNSILTVNQTTNGSFNGLMRNFDGSGSGTLGLTKNGSANLTLSGNNIT
ncbi:MAG: hypothetical protein EBX44_16410, partial [Betaproteobacteria bacterium]|nr:hypothetical protein [Betaproteobacteria bacterium]